MTLPTLALYLCTAVWALGAIATAVCGVWMWWQGTGLSMGQRFAAAAVLAIVVLPFLAVVWVWERME